MTKKRQTLAEWMRSEDFAGKRVVLRADLNIPVLAANGFIVRDESRLVSHRPSLLALHEAGAKVVVLSHFGRPKSAPDAEFSLKPVAEKLGQVLGLGVQFASDCVGEVAEDAVASMRAGDILVLENTRFHGGEKANDPHFARALAAHGEIFVNDAFSIAHRAHASTLGITAFLPSCAGFALEEELTVLSKLLTEPARPVMAICAGAKIGSKLPLLRHLIKRMDKVAVGGGIAHVFLAARGLEVGKSLCEHELTGEAKLLSEMSVARDCELIIPTDIRDEAGEVWQADGMGEATDARDIGPAAVAEICAAIDESKTLIWNGPLGAFETPPSAQGTFAVAHHAAKRVREGKLLAVVGGGETAAAMNAAEVYGDLTHLSTGGGAFLHWLEARPMPVLEALAAETQETKKGEHYVAKD